MIRDAYLKDLKGISEGNVKIIITSLKFPIKVSTPKAKFSTCKNQISYASLKGFSNLHSKSASKLSSSKSFLSFLSFFTLIKHILKLRILFQLLLLSHSGTKRSLKSNIQGTRRALGHLGTQRVLRQ